MKIRKLKSGLQSSSLYPAKPDAFRRITSPARKRLDGIFLLELRGKSKEGRKPLQSGGGTVYEIAVRQNDRAAFKAEAAGT